MENISLWMILSSSLMITMFVIIVFYPLIETYLDKKQKKKELEKTKKDSNNV